MKWIPISNLPIFISTIILVILLSACAQYPQTCPSTMPIGLMDAQEIAADDSQPFQFPLDESPIDEERFFGWFGVSNECPPDAEDCFNYDVRKYHAAEDYRRPAGTPVSAMADGQVSFSGRAGGYGWLVIIDHPQANLYSLYGHLSPSRWRIRSGEVKRGQLIAYLGDSDENGGSAEQPLEPHLHFGVRLGQRFNYPSRGEWRFQAGWIRLCPQDIGWLQPSLVITSQQVPPGGYPDQPVGFLVRWGLELLITVVYTIGGISFLILAIKKRIRWLLPFPGVLLIAAGIVFYYNGMASTFALLAVGMILLAIATWHLIRSFTNNEWRSKNERENE